MAIHQCVKIVVVLVAVAGVALAKEFPADKVPRCNYGDVDCIRKSAEFILQSQNKGIPELEVPTLDPINLNIIRIENPGIVNVSLTMEGGQMAGLSRSKVNYVKGFKMEFDPEDYNEVEVEVPMLTIVSPYIIDGKVFLFPIKGKGNANFTFEGLTMRFRFRGKPISRAEGMFFESRDMYLTMNTTKLYLNFDNLFNGDKFLCEQANALLNRRSEDVFRELKSRVENSFSEEISERINEAFRKYPYTDYFLPGEVPKLKVSPEVYKPEVKSLPTEVAAETAAEDTPAEPAEKKLDEKAEDVPKEITKEETTN